MKTKPIIVIFLVYAVLALTTCRTLMTVLEAPVVSLHSAELINADFNGAQLLCKVQIENPNGFEIPFPEVGWEFFINTNSFVKGVVRNNQRIKARDTTIVEVPVSLNYLDILNTFASLKGRSQIDYKAALAVKFSIPVLGDRVWHFEPEGALPLPQLPRLSSPVMRIEKADLNMVEFYVSVNVENPNVFELPSPRLSFDYQVNNISILRQTVRRTPVAASSVTPVVFGLIVYYADVFRVMPSLRTSSNISSQLNLSFDFGIPVFGSDNFSLQIPGSLPLPGR